MSLYVRQLRDAIEAVRILSPWSFEWQGESAVSLGAKKGRELGRQLLRSHMRDNLRAVLYDGFYKVGAVAARPRTTEYGRGDPTFLAALSQRNRGSGGWEPGWVIGDANDQSLTVERQGFIVRARPEEYRTTSDLVAGASVELRYPKERLHIFPGFYVALSDRPLQPKDTVLRLYWNVTSAGALILTEELTKRLNSGDLSFQLKCVDQPSRFDRCDSAVLYFPAAAAIPISAVVAEVYAQLELEMRDRVPAFALRLADGLGMAEDPGDGDSFGAHRCALLAEGLLRAHDLGARERDRRLEVVRDCFVEAGIDPERPYQRSVDLDRMRGRFVRSPRVSRSLPVSNVDFLQMAARIGQVLCTTAIWDKNMCNWMGAQDDKPDAESIYGSLASNLYSGTSGVGWFLARLSRELGDDRVSATAVGALHHALWSAANQPTSEVGLFTGVVGTAVAAEYVGALLGDTDLRVAAKKLIEERCRSTVKDDPGFDLISGRAGLIVGLLALHTAWGMDELLELAGEHGEVLMRTANRTEEGDSWESPDIPAEKNLTGLSHGASGPAWALAELADVTGGSAFRRGAERALLYERNCFDPLAKNWPDFRKTRPEGQEGTQYAALWCHGATGIGLVRLRLAELFNDPECAQEADRALITVAAAVQRSLAMPDAGWVLCHGLTGNADALLQGSRFTESRSLRRLAQAVGRAGGSRIESWIDSATTGASQIGLMTGLAGIGLFYLRLTDEETPSVLMLRRETFAPTTTSPGGSLP